MSQPDTIELPQDIRRDLERAARESGTTPAQWIADRLPRGKRTARSRRASAEEVVRANAALRATITDYSTPFSADNTDLDQELAAEYANPHED